MNQMPFQPSVQADGGRDLLAAFVAVERELSILPQLSDLERVKFEQDIDVSHLYYSSKIEGTTLTRQRLDDAINLPQSVRDRNR